jgi:glyoxylase I family protein
MLALDGAQLILNTAYEEDSRPAEPDASRVSAHADTGLFFRCRDVDAAYSHLCDKGLSVEAPHVAPYGVKQLYVRDPDGYVLCFQRRAG